MMLHIFFLAIFIVKLDPAHFHPVEVSDTAIDDLWKISRTQMWPWTTQTSAFFVNPTSFLFNFDTTPINNHYRVDNLFSQPRLIETVQVPNTNGYIEPKEIPKFTSQIQQLTPIAITNLKQNDKTMEAIANKKDFKSDARLLEAVKQINPEFVIEEIISVPGRHTHTAVTLEKKTIPIKLLLSSTRSPQFVSQSSMFASKSTLTDSDVSHSKLKYKRKLSKQKNESTEQRIYDSEVKVEATGHTATSGTIPQIPFSSYFLPYLSNDKRDVSKTAALILEPHSKAIVGNGGIAISAPISRAFLKRGTPTNVYFNPESVAIAGVGGKAHAQADLELDLID